MKTRQQNDRSIWNGFAAAGIVCVLVAANSRLVAQTADLGSMDVDTLPTDVLAELPHALDPTGPMNPLVPPTLCGMSLPPLVGLPPGHPVERETGALLTAAGLAYLSNLKLRELQAQFCTPVIDTTLAQNAKTTLPPACVQPPERAALVNPVHPLADLNRADVKAAENVYQDAVERVRLLREQCLELATGTKAAPLPVPVPMLVN